MAKKRSSIVSKPVQKKGKGSEVFIIIDGNNDEITVHGCFRGLLTTSPGTPIGNMKAVFDDPRLEDYREKPKGAYIVIEDADGSQHALFTEMTHSTRRLLIRLDDALAQIVNLQSVAKEKDLQLVAAVADKELSLQSNVISHKEEIALLNERWMNIADACRK